MQTSQYICLYSRMNLGRVHLNYFFRMFNLAKWLGLLYIQMIK